MSISDTHVLLGIVASPHGIKGAVVIRTYTVAPEDLVSYGLLSDKAGDVYKITSITVKTPTSVIAFIEGVIDRNQAETLRGLELYIPKDQLPLPEEDEYYYSDLIGLKILDQDSQEVGVVQAIQNYGAGDVLEIKSSSGAQFSIAFTHEAVPEISISKGFLTIDNAFLITPEQGGPEKGTQK